MAEQSTDCIMHDHNLRRCPAEGCTWSQTSSSGESEMVKSLLVNRPHMEGEANGTVCAMRTTAENAVGFPTQLATAKEVVWLCLAGETVTSQTMASQPGSDMDWESTEGNDLRVSKENVLEIEKGMRRLSLRAHRPTIAGVRKGCARRSLLKSSRRRERTLSSHGWHMGRVLKIGVNAQSRIFGGGIATPSLPRMNGELAREQVVELLGLRRLVKDMLAAQEALQCKYQRKVDILERELRCCEAALEQLGLPPDCTPNNVWLLDSGASTHSTNNGALLSDFDDTFTNTSTTANGVRSGRGRGTASVDVFTDQGPKVMHLPECKYNPACPKNLLSLSRLVRLGYWVQGNQDWFYVTDPLSGSILCQGTHEARGAFVVQTSPGVPQS